ncbi:MAG: 2-C-methyl-D-erythritol 2,4-cyclodiphosphate synthase, partial [Candidatus Omnitrophica bacterium]|nr:2-C-methyl-D-erythritol 2,4-cyclodiphosphate synthase [Candidatus Omnitrophota bacterium]
QGLAGHSDADVLLHAIADALFGAVGEADIGEQFPSSNPRYRNAHSQIFVEAARLAIKRRGWAIQNLDAIVIADAPHLGGHKSSLRQSISRLLHINPEQVSIKAKTTEAFCPSGQGIAAQAVVLVNTRNKKTKVAK